MHVTYHINELRDLEFPYDKLPIAELNENLYCGQGKFTLVVDLSFDDNSILTITLHYKWYSSIDNFILTQYDAYLHHISDSENDRHQTFYLLRGLPRITVREAYNLLRGRAAYKECFDLDGNRYSAWLKLNFYELDKQANYRISEYRNQYKPPFEKVLENYPILELREPAMKLALMTALKKGDRVPVTLIRPRKTEKVFIEANPKLGIPKISYPSSRRYGKTKELTHKTDI